MLCRRDDATKVTVTLDDVVAEVGKLLESSQAALLDEALQLREARTVRATSLEEAEEAAQSGFAVLPGDLLAADGAEARSTPAGSRCAFSADAMGRSPALRKMSADLEAVVARAYRPRFEQPETARTAAGTCRRWFPVVRNPSCGKGGWPPLSRGER